MKGSLSVRGQGEKENLAKLASDLEIGNHVIIQIR